MFKAIKSGIAAAALVVVLVISVGAAQHFSLLPHLGNPVREQRRTSVSSSPIAALPQLGLLPPALAAS